MYSASICISFFLLSQIASSSPVPADAQMPLMAERGANPQDDAVIASNGPTPYINKMEPNKSVVCKASDTACVMGKAPPSQKRDDTQPTVQEYYEIDRRALSIQEAAQAAGINDLQKPVVTSNANNATATSTTTTKPSTSKPTNGICKASDTECVMGVRDAIPESQAEADFDPVAVRISELQAELEEIRGKRAMLMKRAPMPAATTPPITSRTTMSTASMTATNSLNSTSSSTTTTTGYPRSTNAFGRIVCKASDVECVTGQT